MVTTVYNSGRVITTSLVGTEIIDIDNGGAVVAGAPASAFANLATVTGTTTASIVGTETFPLAAGTTAERVTFTNMNGFFTNFTTSAMSNSTSITLSAAFTALTFTQTSTGNTVNLPAAPLNGQICGFSITNNVTNLTVSSAANTVTNGAATSTTSAGASLWWIYQTSNTTWYKFNGVYLSQ